MKQNLVDQTCELVLDEFKHCSLLLLMRYRLFVFASLCSKMIKKTNGNESFAHAVSIMVRLPWRWYMTRLCVNTACRFLDEGCINGAVNPQ